MQEDVFLCVWNTLWEKLSLKVWFDLILIYYHVCWGWGDTGGYFLPNLMYLLLLIFDLNSLELFILNCKQRFG